MTEIVVFTGPTLPAAAVLELVPEADVRPPAALGDVYRAAQARPRAIAMVDGYFEKVPSPWHKELLWVLNEGIPLFGAASMGALRAAELEPFGMVGIGRIYEWFHTGQLEDDDEVAVAHLGAEDDFRAVTEAMVNVRATIERAVTAGVLDQAEAEAVRAGAKSLYYTDRTWSAILGKARLEGAIEPAATERYRDWLVQGRVDLKADDAREMLAVVGARISVGPTSTPRSWSFEHTTFWEWALQEISEDGEARRAGARSEAELVLDELRLQPDEHAEVTGEAFVRWLASAYAQARSLELRAEDTQAVLDEMRTSMDLFEPADVQSWLAQEEMDVADLHRQVREETFVAWARARSRLTLDPIVVDVLRMRRRYSELVERARAKQDALGSSWTSDGLLGGEVVSDEVLITWWFETELGEPVPTDLDHHLWANQLGDRSSFLLALRRERSYRGMA